MPFDLSGKTVVVLPDLYVDALAHVGPWDTLRTRMDTVAANGGGNVPIGTVDLRVGGNAANLALALARLGADVTLIAKTNRVGRGLLEEAARGTTLRTDRVRSGDQAMTLGLECEEANIMLSHAGPVQDFGPKALEAEDRRRIATADAVAVVNWAQNMQGTALLQDVAKQAGGFVYVDTADPRHRGAAMQELASHGAWQDVSAWGLNENELRAFAQTVGCLQDDNLETARALSSALDIHLDLHTRDLAASVDGGEVVSVAADPSPGRRATGAGDAWNAGNLAGHLLGWKAEQRLALAHEVATRYVCSTHGAHPTPADLRKAVVA